MRNKLLIIFSIALLLRLGLVFSAYHGDLNNNISWATLAVERGLNGFYEGEEWSYSAPNQPPLTIITFSLLRKTWLLVENTSWWLNNNLKLFPSSFIWFWEQKGMVLLIKLPSILADLGIGWMIYQYIVHKAKSGKRKALFLTSIWLFNPIVWYNSTVWGQTDSIVNLLGLVAILTLLKKNLKKFAVFMTLSLLFKGSLAIFTPILLFVAIKQKHSIWVWIRSTFYSFLTIIAVSIWFHPSFNLLFWLIGLYTKRILPGEIGYLTANAFNFWWLVEPSKVFDSTLYFGISARIWGFLAIGTTIVAVILWLSKKVSDKKIIISISLTALTSFLFMTRIHERYLYPFFPPATLLFGFLPGIWIPYTILTITHLLNLYHLFWAPGFPILMGAYDNPALPGGLAILNISVLFYLLRHLRKANI